MGTSHHGAASWRCAAKGGATSGCHAATGGVVAIAKACRLSTQAPRGASGGHAA